MPYVYPNAEALDKTALVGSHQCVALVQHYAKAPHTAHWRAGKPAKGDMSIPVGTAIATFVDGKYPNLGTGNHAALYLGQAAGGIIVIDQWKGDKKKPTVSKRYIRAKGKGWTATNSSAQATTPMLSLSLIDAHENLSAHHAGERLLPALHTGRTVYQRRRGGAFMPA